MILSNWNRVAQALGLQFDGRRVLGTLHGQHVELFVRRDTRTVHGSSGLETEYDESTVISAPLALPLDLGLCVGPRGTLHSVVSGLFGGNATRIGDPAFEAMFVIGSDDVSRAVRALTPPLRQALSVGPHLIANFALHDGGFWVQRNNLVQDQNWLVATIRAAANLAQLLESARASIPTAAALVQHRAQWIEFAHRHALSGTDTPLGVYGEYEGCRVRVHAVRVAAHSYHFEVGVDFREPLGLGLLLRRPGPLGGLRWLLGGEDLVVGDKPFDDAFVVKCARADVLATVLDASIRAELVQIHTRVAPVTLSDTTIALSIPSWQTAANDVPRFLEHLIPFARTIEDRAMRVRAGNSPAPTPYR